MAPSSTESAIANGDTRTLRLYHTHTGETIDATFRVNGRYDPTVLAQLNHFLRDWRNNDEHQMDPRLFDTVWEAYRTAGATDRIQIYSAYRSPGTNAMLRRRSRAVAEHSQHMLGRAMDTTLPGFPMSRIREAGMKLQHGGVGWYPSSNFVHLDVGSVRSWPRMSYDQLARIFPDGKTVHISADGRTLSGYDQARLEIAQHGGVEVPPEQQSTGFFAWLFGGGNTASAAREDEEDRRAPAAPVAVASVAQTAVAPAPAAAKAPTLANVAAASIAPQTAGPRIGGANLQVASLETASPDGKVPAFAGSIMPLPPKRPADLADATVPLPPARPDTLDRMQTASIRYSGGDRSSGVTTSANGLPMFRRSGLPPIITRGTGQAIVPSRALAFASSETLAEPRLPPLPVARPASLTKPLALRGARRSSPSWATASSTPTFGSGHPGNLAGPKLTGLRQAMRWVMKKAAL